ncbi:MAG: amino-acid N-acetyltransferase [Treponema sp.]|nr:amino-acid N-acetyltransferase [Treponema sp.]
MDEFSQVEIIREAFHYQSRFSGSTMVFKVEYPVIEHSLFTSFVGDLALLSKTGYRILIVPGAKETAVFDSASRFMTGFSGNRVDAVIGNFIRARGLGVVDGVDMGQKGMVDKFYIESMRRILDLGIVPILPGMGWSLSGKPYYVPADDIALKAALKLAADKLFIISLSGGPRKDNLQIPEHIECAQNGRIIRLTPQEAEELLKINSPGTGTQAVLSELALALKASNGGVKRVHIIDGAEGGAVLKELFSNQGTGTMVYADEYESIRGIRSADIPEILRLMEPMMQQGTLLRRNADDIQAKREDFVVFVIDSQIRACGALHIWEEDQAEIAALATDPAYAARGLGGHIVKYLIDRAKKHGCKRVFALSTQSNDWFESQGFREAALQSLPEGKRAIYDNKRNSKVFALDLLTVN